MARVALGLNSKQTPDSVPAVHSMRFRKGSFDYRTQQSGQGETQLHFPGTNSPGISLSDGQVGGADTMSPLQDLLDTIVSLSIPVTILQL